MVILQVSIKVSVGVSAQAEVITYPQALLTTSQSLAASGQHGIAIVVAHIACEIAVERALGAAFAAANVAHLEEPVEAMMNGFNLANERHRKLYNALTGRAVENEAFWQAFKTSATLRNKITHNAYIANATDSATSLAATTALVAYL